MKPSIGIIGAGISGLTAARELKQQGFDVTVFERGRGPGGRAARRRADPWSFDHGAQYFTARDGRFQAEVTQWLETGTVALWEPEMAVAKNGVLEPRKSSTARYVGTPGMNALAQSLARDIPLRTESTVTAVDRTAAKGEAPWSVTVAATIAGSYDAVVFAAPPPQWLPLLKEPTSFDASARAVTFAPTWAAMIGLEKPLPLAADGIFLDDPVLSWAARNSSKPGRDTPPAWVLHANPAWAKGKENLPAEEILPVMIDAFGRATGVEIADPVHAAAHRWRYSRAEATLGVEAFWDAELRIGACGDWCAGSRIEGAYLSGLAIAQMVTNHYRS
jgi:renalase